jgi:glycerol-1-phosphate dehydrogenase [NAD(P)+]
MVKVLTMARTEEFMNCDIYKKHTFICECGKIHSMPIDEIYVEENALDRLADAPVRLNLGRNVMVVSDPVVMGIMGEKVMEKLAVSACRINTVLFNIPITPDEKSLTKFLLECPSDIDFFVAIGSGAVNDITRFFSYRLNKPYISIPTAPSMDGYSAKVSLLFINGLKQTFNAKYPCAIYADVNILKNAPRTLILAGLGDLVAKATACADWRISNIINGEYFCNYTYRIIMDTLKKCIDCAMESNMTTPESIRTLMDGLLVSGIAMHWLDTSRPAAGAEHHITHFWGMQAKKPQHLHGIECAVGTMVMLKAYGQLMDLDFQSINEEEVSKNMLSKDDWQSEIRVVFGDKYDFIMDQQKNRVFDKERIKENIIKIKQHEKEIKEVISETLQLAEGLEKLFSALKIPMKPSDLDIATDMFSTSFRWAKEVRNKYTVLDLIYDLGVMDSVLDKIVKEY